MESRSDVTVGEAADAMEEVFALFWLWRESTWGGSGFAAAVVGG